MKKSFTKLIAAFALLVLFTLPIKIWATDITVSMTGYAGGSGNGYVNNNTSSEISGVTFVACGYIPGTGQVRGNKTSIGEGSNYNFHIYNTDEMPGAITKIVLKNTSGGFQNNMYAATGTSSQASVSSITNLTSGTLSNDGKSFTWTFSENLGITYFKLCSTAKFTNGSVTGCSIEITYTTGGGQQTVSAPTFDPASGTTFVDNLSVKITPSANTTMYYTTNGNAPSSSTGTGYTTEQTVNLTATTTIRAIAYDGSNNPSSVAEATYTKVTPLANIAALTANTTTGTYYVTLTNATVTYVNGSNAYIQDASGAVLLHKSNHNLTAGSTLSGTATVTYQLYNGNPQITDLSGVSSTSGTAPDPTQVAQSAWNYTFNNVISQYFQITDATITKTNNNYYVSLGGESIQLYKSGGLGTLDTSKTYTITGFPTIYQSGSNDPVKELTLYAAPEVVVSTDPSINANDLTIEDNATSGSIAYTIDNPATGTNLTAQITAGNDGNWLTLGAVSASAVSFTCTANEINSNRTATVTLSYSGAADKTVTITQEKYFAPTSLSFAFDGGRADIANTTGLKQENLGTDYASSPYLKFDNSNNTTSSLVLKINERPGTLSFKVKGNPGGNPSVWAGTFQVLTSTNGTSWSVLASYDDLSSTATTKTIENIDADVRYFKWVYSKTSGNVALGDINLTKYVAPAQDYTLSIGLLENIQGILVFDASDENNPLNENGETSFTVAEGTEIRVSIDGMDDCYFIGQSSFLVSYPDSQNAAITELEPNVYYSFIMPSANASISVIPEQADQYTLTVAGLDHISNVQINSANLDANNQVADICEQSSVVVTGFTLANGYVISSVTLTSGGETTTVTTNTSNLYEFQMPSSDATLTFTTANLPTYTLATSIENGRHYIIVGIDATKGAFAMTNDKGNNRNTTTITVSTDNTTATVSNENVYEFVINGPDADGRYTIYDANWKTTNGGYLYAASSGSNYLKTRQFNEDANSLWSIAFDDDNAVLSAQGTNARNLIRFNPNGNNTPIFASYDPNATTPIGTLPYLYVKDETTPQYDFYKDIAAWSSGASDKWYFIASPLASDYSLTGTDMVSGTYEDYDLYRLNNTTWENYSNSDHTSNFTTLNSGTGYLYANSENITLHFSGSINTFTTDANVKTLSKGWNLIGNPYHIPIYINKPYYRMNADGSAVETEDGITSEAIMPCSGVVIYAAGANETVTFSTEAISGATGNHGNIQMTLAQQATNRGNATTLDNAIVSFNEGSQLEKFYFGTQNANIYIPQGTEEYTIVSAEAQGEMPVNFKANEDGQYTISVNPKDVEMGYLHLIDNIAGQDIDLLATPSYTFNAKSDDYASRFRLVFSANNAASAENDNFAFISDGQIIFGGSDNATLQVIDMLGRIVITRRNGTHTISTSEMTPGVYVLQLTDGTDVKTQKIIVK